MLRKPNPSQPATPSSLFSGSHSHAVLFKHPGYADDFGQNVLLNLYSFDRPDGGLHYGTALVACGMIAGNKWDGYFTRTRNGGRIQMAFDHILTDSSYYFYLASSPAETYRYPIYPSFEHWSFPHDDLPSQWSAVAARRELHEEEETTLAPPSASNLTSAIIRRDGCCRMTGQRDYIETAHLCPRSEALWFESNGMGRYNINGQLLSDYIVDDVANAIALRPDCHYAFDDKKFVIVPKESQWAVHFLGLTNDLGRFHHNTAIDLDPVVSTNYVLTRFAWAIFPLVHRFLKVGIARDLRLRVTEDGELREIVKAVPAEEVRKFSTDSRARSTSPKKRKAGFVGTVTDNLTDQKRRRLGLKESEDDVLDGKTSARLPKYPKVPTCQILDRKSPAQDTSSYDKTAEAESSIFGEDSKTGLPTPLNAEKNYDLEELKRAWIQRQRPLDPAKYCCSYPDAEAALRAGLPGKREFGGGHLCLECLGFEYSNNADDSEGL